MVLKSWIFPLDLSEVQTGKHTDTLLNFIFIERDILLA